MISTMYATPAPPYSSHDSPYSIAVPPQSSSNSSTPSNNSSHFDPHDPAWFTPSINAAFSSQQGYSTEYAGGGGRRGPTEWEEGMEVLQDGGFEQEVFEQHRRHSDGGSSIYEPVYERKEVVQVRFALLSIARIVLTCFLSSITNRPLVSSTRDGRSRATPPPPPHTRHTSLDSRATRTRHPTPLRLSSRNLPRSTHPTPRWPSPRRQWHRISHTGQAMPPSKSTSTKATPSTGTPTFPFHRAEDILSASRPPYTSTTPLLVLPISPRARRLASSQSRNTKQPRLLDPSTTTLTPVLPRPTIPPPLALLPPARIPSSPPPRSHRPLLPSTRLPLFSLRLSLPRPLARRKPRNGRLEVGRLVDLRSLMRIRKRCRS
jgi:hypothetical protein